MRRTTSVAGLAAFLLVLLADVARATPVARARTAYDVDWTWAAVGGIGKAGTGSLALTGVTGPVERAYLYWHGIDQVMEGGDGSYDNETVQINGSTVMGTSLGDATTNCWGEGSSRAFVADVTPHVTGNGLYALAGFAAKPGHDANGASLIVLYDDGDASNDRDLAFFEGNDSNHPEGFPGEDDGWHAVLEGVNYRSGAVRVHLHVGDGQAFDDGGLTFSSAGGDVRVADTSELWDGTSVAAAGGSRASSELWDVHSFDLSPAFGTAGVYTFELDGQERVEDCLGLVAVIVDLPFGTAPRCGDGLLFFPEECDDGNTVDGDCCSASCSFEPRGLVCANPGDACLEGLCDGKGTCDLERQADCREPTAPRGAQLSLRNVAPDTKDRVIWQWTTGVTTPAELGDPLASTSFELCIYDKGTGALRLLARTSVAPGGLCGTRPCWARTRNGFRFGSKTGPMRKLRLEGGLPGRARISALAQGAELALPASPIAPALKIQLRASNGLCWGADFTVPARNDGGRFRGRSD